MKVHQSDTALVVIDPQNDVSSEHGVSWGLVGDSVKENDTIANIERLFKAAKDEASRSTSHLTISTLPTWRGGSAERESR